MFLMSVCLIHHYFTVTTLLCSLLASWTEITCDSQCSLHHIYTHILTQPSPHLTLKLSFSSLATMILYMLQLWECAYANANEVALCFLGMTWRKWGGRAWCFLKENHVLARLQPPPNPAHVTIRITSQLSLFVSINLTGHSIQKQVHLFQHKVAIKKKNNLVYSWHNWFWMCLLSINWKNTLKIYLSVFLLQILG
jgi:hypothetical protein